MSNQQESFEEKFQNLNNTADTTSQFDPQDITNNKVMAILAYFGILVLIPIFAAKESKYARFHANQGLILFIAGIAIYIVQTIFYSIFSLRLWWLISTVVGIIGLVIFVLAIIGIVNAAQGKAKELPLVGNFKILNV
ncbi:MAG: zinc ribbon domain-containing protein [Prevotella sp.]|nr:zinc ribbon domain-containing protein [Prevotella sp.]